MPMFRDDPTQSHRNGQEASLSKGITMVAMPTISTLQKVSNLLNSDKGLNGTFGALNPEESNVEMCEVLQYEFQEGILTNPGKEAENLDKSRDLALKDLMPKKYRNDPGACRTVRAKGIVQFVVVKRNKDQEDGDWEFPDRQEFIDLLNTIEARNSASKNGYSATLEYNNMWGQVPILGLRIKSLVLLDGFRNQIDDFQCPMAEYTTFPKLGLDRKFAITIMLWQDLASFPIETLPRNLLDRNPELQGGLRVNHVKSFKDSDLDMRGKAMDKVRLVQIAVSYTHLTLPTTPYV